jgi:putative CocE/NonD family hydrolase
VFLPLEATGPVPVLISMSPYGKDIYWKDKEPESYAKIPNDNPYLVYELPDPVQWTKEGYALVRVDSYGTGASPGTVDVWSGRDMEGYYDAVEWAGTQEWSTGRVAVLGVSYYSGSGVMVAALQPPHLTAVVPWEVGGDNYGPVRQNGIYNTFFLRSWFDGWVVANQYGHGIEDPEELKARRVDYADGSLEHEWIDEFWKAGRIADVSQVQVPFLTAANVTSAQLTLRENLDLFQRAGSEHKHLRVQSGTHIEPFYTPEAFAMQKAFLDRWMKDDTSAEELPKVTTVVRKGQDFSWRTDTQWPLTGTTYRTLHLDANDLSLKDQTPSEEGQATYLNLPDPTAEIIQRQAEESEAAGVSIYMDPSVIVDHLNRSREEHAHEQPWRLMFSSEPFAEETTVVGPITLTLEVDPSADDADLFIAVRDVAPDGTETYYYGVDNPETPVALGWLRLSHAAEDPELTSEHLPVFHHRGPAILGGGPRTVRIPVGPTSVVFQQGHRLVLEIASRDPHGSFPFLHVTPSDRKSEGDVTVRTGPGHTATLEFPVVPGKQA